MTDAALCLIAAAAMTRVWQEAPPGFDGSYAVMAIAFYICGTVLLLKALFQ